MSTADMAAMAISACVLIVTIWANRRMKAQALQAERNAQLAEEHAVSAESNAKRAEEHVAQVRELIRQARRDAP